jgi:hypothetical protein
MVYRRLLAGLEEPLKPAPETPRRETAKKYDLGIREVHGAQWGVIGSQLSVNWGERSPGPGPQTTDHRTTANREPCIVNRGNGTGPAKSKDFLSCRRLLRG